MNKVVAYFDFDGTLTYRDTFIPFILHVVGSVRFFSKLPQLLIIACLYIAKIIDNQTAKERVLQLFFTNLSYGLLLAKALTFTQEYLCKKSRLNVYKRLQYHLNQGHAVLIVSANLALYLRLWAQIHQIADVIATEIAFNNNYATGFLATANCYGVQKLIRVKEYLKTQQLEFSYSYGYGNSAGDYQLLDYVDEAYFVNKSRLIKWSDYRKQYLNK